MSVFGRWSRLGRNDPVTAGHLSEMYVVVSLHPLAE